MNLLYNILYIMLFPYLYVTIILRKRKSVLIYQMGKVGSDTVYTSLKKHNINAIHLHYMHPYNIKKIINNRKKTIKINLFFIYGKFVYKHLILTKRKVKIITIVREPIQRNISAFFQNILKIEGKNYQKIKIDELKNDFLSKYDHYIPLKWYDNEFLPVTGIDIYKYKFDKDLGYAQFKHKNIEVLLFKVELEDNIKEKIVIDFMDISDDNFKIIRTNLSDKKDYYNKYKEFKKLYIYSLEMKNEIQNSKFYNHFY